MAKMLLSITGFRAPQAVAVANNVLAVADTANNRIGFLDAHLPTGANPVWIGMSGIDPKAEGLRLPSALAFTTPDELIVADTQNQHLDRYKNLGGAWTYQDSIWDFPGIVPSVGAIVDVVPGNSENLLFLDADGRRILSCNLATGTVAVHYADPQWMQPHCCGEWRRLPLGR
jgi:hypothetical protein